MKLLSRFLIWALTFEHTVGLHSGMGPVYLHQLSEMIRKEEGRLHRLELNS